MSKLSSSDCATRLTSAASRLTPRLILPDLHHDGARGDALDHGHLGHRQPGGADDVHEAALGGDRDIGDGRARHGEIQNAVGIGRQRPQVGRKFDAVFRQAGEHAGILAQQFRTRRFQRAGQHRARRFRNDAHQRAAHPAAGPRNDQSHIGHGFTSARGIAGAGCSGNQAGPSTSPSSWPGLTRP